jgi:hypothetical protein
MPLFLTSWKDIANYLGKGVRTVQRWELQLGLPVRRPKNGKRHMVIASSEEIDQWFHAQGFSNPNRELERLRERVALLETENAQLRSRLELSGQPSTVPPYKQMA